MSVKLRKNLLVGLVIVVALCLTIGSYNVGRYPSDLVLSIYETSRNDVAVPIEYETCTPLDHIFFLKTHKCGSSTVQNILMRRGLKNNLNFVLPEKNNYLGHPDPFDKTQIGSGLMDSHGSFDIFTHHSRFSPENVRNLMPPDTKRVTILREPASLFESIYHYYHFQQMFENKNLDLATLLSNYEVADLISLFENTPRLAYRIGHNQMAFDLGFNKKDFRDEQKIADLLAMIESEFDLVFLSEYMEVSMVLLADLMCWPLEEVTFLKLNARPDDSFHTVLSLQDKEKIRALNNVDTAIYSHFRGKFKQRVLEYGRQRMEADLERLVQLNLALAEQCVATVVQPKKNASRFLYPVTHYELHADAPSHCKDLTLNELVFTDRIREQQRARFAARAKLAILLELT